MDRSVDLVGRQTAAAHGHLVPVEDGADRASFDTESGGQFIYGRSGLVAGDQLCDLVGVELPCPPGRGTFLGRRAEVVGSASFWSSVSRASTCGFGL